MCNRQKIQFLCKTINFDDCVFEKLTNIKKLRIYKTNGSNYVAFRHVFVSQYRFIKPRSSCVSSMSSRRITVKSTQGNYQRFIYLAAELLSYKMIVQRNAQFGSSLMHVALNINESTQ